MRTNDPVTVFVVEDNENVREAVTGYLRLEGMEVSEFGEISPAEKALVGGIPDILILDVMLPDGDGFLLAKRIREKSNVPILFLTARDQESDRITGLELGADDYVVKPFSPKELVLRVKAILRRSAEEESVDTGAFRLEESELTISETEHRVDTHVKNLRRKLGSQEWIETVRGFGYRFNGRRT
jgi:DNA-binding response OmpR family regulator